MIYRGGMHKGAMPTPGFIPPHIIHAIAKNGNERQKELAIATIVTSSQARGKRQIIGPIVKALAVPAGGKRRSIYDAKGKEKVPGDLARSEDQPPVGDSVVNSAFDGAGYTYDFYNAVFKRNSIDDHGMRLASTVHYGIKYQNAFWDGNQMVYGDGDGDIFRIGAFTGAIDVIAHEFSHGITQYEANLSYSDQPGALNESFSDVLGITIKQHLLGISVDKSDWLIGPGIFSSRIHGVAIRSMANPGTAYDDTLLGKDPQPAHMKDYVNTKDDCGGVHINSGIPSKAYYLTAMEIGGNAWEKACPIWYIALRDLLRTNSNFQDAAKMTYRAAGDLFGDGSQEQNAVKNGWAGVGIQI
jgi:Zn-dependent metalloprotease